jgi:hypothetical protein
VVLRYEEQSADAVREGKALARSNVRPGSRCWWLKGCQREKLPIKALRRLFSLHA